MTRGAGSFGARPLTAMRVRLLTLGVEALPKSWRKQWMIKRILATPPWACFKEIKCVYQRADQLTKKTGIKHVVDHIIPLNNPRVSGLHVPWHMQVITDKENGFKSNKWCPEQMELF